MLLSGILDTIVDNKFVNGEFKSAIILILSDIEVKVELRTLKIAMKLERLIANLI